MWGYAVQHNEMHCQFTIQCHAMQRHAVRCLHAMHCHIMRCHAMHCHAINALSSCHALSYNALS